MPDDDEEITVRIEDEGPFAGLKIVAKKLLPCPCGKNVYQSLNPPVVIHSEPRCRKFDELEPLEFLRWMRRTYKIPGPEDPVN